MPQAGSRKRQAPGASPVGHNLAQPAFRYNQQPLPGNGDSFLSWDQKTASPEENNMSVAPDSFNTLPYDAMAPQNFRPEAANQLARRPVGNQMVPRVPYNGSTGDAWPDMMLGQERQSDSSWQDDDALLDQRALEAKKAAQNSRKSIPPFVQKLSSFLDESRNTELIRWSSSGDSFIVLDEDEFARTLIPELFKHNNYASFVRQLNMYGFHKRVGLSDNSMRASERKNKSPSEYSNPYFKRGRPNLLWLIQKPKPSHSKARSTGRGKHVDDNGEEDVDDIFENESGNASKDVPEDAPFGRVRQPLMIGQGERGLAKEELSAVHQEIRNIRQQQSMISNVIAKIRSEHEQLYGQAAAFQELHNRHENSINAILTFLATVYNRSLESNQNMANLFAGPLPHEKGSVVDVDDFGGGTGDGLGRRPSRRQPLLLKAPPQENVDVQNPINATSGANLAQAPDKSQYNSTGASTSPQASAGIIEEIYDQDTSSNAAKTPRFPPSNAATPGIPERDIISIINSTNARDLASPQNRMDFPEALSHLQNADGKSPLSPKERSSVLQLMANSSAQANADGGNNALVSPNPPTVPLPNLEAWNATEQDLQYLEKTLKEQDEKVNNLSNMLQPLSPSGSIPGLNDTQGQGYIPPPGGDGLDFSTIFNEDDYFNDPTIDANLEFGNSGEDFENGDNFSFDNPDSNVFGGDSANDLSTESNVGNIDSSEGTSPANTITDAGSVQENLGSPRKKQRRS